MWNPSLMELLRRSASCPVASCCHIPYSAFSFWLLFSSLNFPLTFTLTFTLTLIAFLPANKLLRKAFRTTKISPFHWGWGWIEVWWTKNNGAFYNSTALARAATDCSTSTMLLLLQITIFTTLIYGFMATKNYCSKISLFRSSCEFILVEFYA